MKFNKNTFHIVHAQPITLSRMEGNKVVIKEGTIVERAYKLKSSYLRAEDYHKVARAAINDALTSYQDEIEAGKPIARDQVMENVARGNLYAEEWIDDEWQPIEGSAVKISDLIKESDTGQQIVPWPLVLGEPDR